MLCFVGLRVILVYSRFWGDVLYMWVITERLFLDPETTCLFWQPFTLPISNRLFIFKTLKNEITGMFLSFFPFKFELEMMELDYGLVFEILTGLFLIFCRPCFLSTNQ
jgi:hypothetical protein